MKIDNVISDDILEERLNALCCSNWKVDHMVKSKFHNCSARYTIDNWFAVSRDSLLSMLNIKENSVYKGVYHDSPSTENRAEDTLKEKQGLFFTCELCGAADVSLNCIHIKPFSTYPEHIKNSLYQAWHKQDFNRIVHMCLGCLESIEENFLDSIPDRVLPLHVNMDWLTPSVRKRYRDRLKSVNLVP